MGRLKEMDLAANVSERRARIRRALIYVFLLALVFLALVSTCALFGIRFNVSESLPGSFLSDDPSVIGLTSSKDDFGALHGA